MKITLREWQKEAYTAWAKSGYRSIIQSMTGSGKSYLGLYAIQELRISTLIVVPTIQLLDQWKEHLITLGIKPEDLGTYYGESKDFKNVTIAVINSVYDLVDLDKKFQLIIIDEVHRISADSWKNLLLNNKFKYSLGLTATLKREDGNEDFLIKKIGPVVYKYTTKDAIENNALNDFSIYILGLDLVYKDQERLTKLDLKINELMNEFDSKDSAKAFKKAMLVLKTKKGNVYAAAQLLRFINKRKEFFNNSGPKVYKAAELIESVFRPPRRPLNIYYNNIINNNIIINNKIKEKNDNLSWSCNNISWSLENNKINNMDSLMNPLGKISRDSNRYGVGGHKVIVFGEYIEAADKLHTLLKQKGIDSWVYYSGNKNSKFKFTAKQKREIIKNFKEADSGILITVKALDEGLDVKDADIGIALGYNKTTRQAVQRMGRILRKAEGKHPKMFLFYYKDTSDRFAAKSFSDNFKGVGEIKWL